MLYCGCARPDTSGGKRRRKRRIDLREHNSNLKATRDYGKDALEEARSRGDTRHPYNKPEITNCARCGCESSQHEVDEGTDARERGNDSFAEGDYRAALIAYSKYVSYFCHLFATSNCSPERSSC